MLKTIDMTRIVSGKNIRNEHDSEIAELADSIEKQGLINPILVQALENGKYQIIAGHRRYEAVKRLGLPFIECNVIEYLSEKDRILTQIAENTQRKDMSAYELVKVFDDLKAKYKLRQKQIAAMFGKSHTWVTNQYQAVELLELKYGKDIPENAKKLGANNIKYEAKKEITGDETILCAGMKVKVAGHKYTILCSTNEAENNLRAFIKSHKLRRK